MNLTFILAQNEGRRWLIYLRSIWVVWTRYALPTQCHCVPAFCKFGEKTWEVRTMDEKSNHLRCQNSPFDGKLSRTAKAKDAHELTGYFVCCIFQVEAACLRDSDERHGDLSCLHGDRLSGWTEKAVTTKHFKRGKFGSDRTESRQQNFSHFRIFAFFIVLVHFSLGNISSWHATTDKSDPGIILWPVNLRTRTENRSKTQQRGTHTSESLEFGSVFRTPTLSPANVKWGSHEERKWTFETLFLFCHFFLSISEDKKCKSYHCNLLLHCSRARIERTPVLWRHIWLDLVWFSIDIRTDLFRFQDLPQSLNPTAGQNSLSKLRHSRNSGRLKCDCMSTMK